MLHDPTLSLNFERGKRVERILLIAQRYAAGAKTQKIADDFECSPHTVIRIARVFEIPKRERGNVYLKKACIKAYKRGLPIVGIASKLKRSEAWVSKIAGERGILRRQFKSRDRHVA